jgi:hypothetical protein
LPIGDTTSEMGLDGASFIDDRPLDPPPHALSLAVAQKTWWTLPRLRPGIGVSSRVEGRHPLTADTPDIGSRPRSSATPSVWLYFCLSQGLRIVEELLAARGIIVSHETVRQWACPPSSRGAK